MKLRSVSYSLVVVATAVVVVSLEGLGWMLRSQPRPTVTNQSIVVQSQRPSVQTTTASPQVLVGTPEEYQREFPAPRYTYRNEFPTDPSKPLPLYVIDTQTGKETRLGDDNAPARFRAQDENYLLWYTGCGANCAILPYGLYAYAFATGENTFISNKTNDLIFPKIAGEWAAFGSHDPRGIVATLYAANLQTHEVLTLTHELNAQDGGTNGRFGISPQLAAWFTFSYPEPSKIVVYDLAARTEITRLTNFQAAFAKQGMRVYALSPGETVITWSRNYGYDLVTHSYFRIEAIRPPGWEGQLSTSVSPITETNRVLYWTFQMQDGTVRHVRAPLIDATPSAAPCVAGQNLVQNGDLENVAQHALWQQSGSPSNLLVDDPPPGAPNGGAWAIRLGRYRNAQQSIRQLVAIPSGVKALTLHFDVQVATWDRWGGDWLEVDLVDPASGQSYLVTPVRWRNTQLASPDWLPVTVQIAGWPAVDAPVYLEFRGVTDWAIPTDFTLDNVQLVTSCQ